MQRKHEDGSAAVRARLQRGGATDCCIDYIMLSSRAQSEYKGV